MKLFGLDRNIYVAGFVSLLMDISSEMIYPLLPMFLSSVLGVNKSLIGLIEGIAESTASVLKAFSGWLSDRLGRRKGLMMAGYAISALSRPIIALAAGWHAVLAGRFVDRAGKGVRTAPRDAIIAESTYSASFGKAFGFHRGMDTVGAVIGPALAFFLLSASNNNFREIFWISLAPAVLAVLMIFTVREKKEKFVKYAGRPKLSTGRFDWRFKFFVVIVALFSLGNSSDAFLILRTQQVGIPTALVPAVYLVYNSVYSLSSMPAGIAADRFGRRRIMLLGFILFAVIYFAFGRWADRATIWIIFGFYGLFMGLTDGVQKAYLAEIIPPDMKATAFGIYNTAAGLALLPASLIGGWLWDHVSPAATFYYGAVMAAMSAVLFIVFIVVVPKSGTDTK